MRSAQRRLVPTATLAGIIVLGAGACGASKGARAPAPPAEERSTAELEALYRARTDSARMRFTEADVRFMRNMIAHHAQALVMTALVPDRTPTPSVRTLAARITSAQQDEIATMRRWLRDRGQPLPPPTHAGHHAGSMPGMLTQAQLRELEAAQGEGFDRLFLRYMIQHHEGAVTMVRDLLATDGAAQDEEVFRFASDAQVDQATEIDRMRRMLSALDQTGNEE